PVRGNIHRLKKLLAQDFAGVDWSEVGHGPLIARNREAFQCSIFNSIATFFVMPRSSLIVANLGCLLLFRHTRT
ncbi:MAG TPA: hypothetical protein VEX87_21635, partial [Skermanella sp.]|nr:hypothetical protein [Skermanella sp.]